MSEISNIKFPTRRSTHEGWWLPLFLEPLVGSGERICIGVAASDGKAVEVVGVPRLERLSSLYGQATGSLQWAADLALKEISYAASERGIERLGEVKAPVDGMSFGAIRKGAGKDLEDLARAALRQASSLAALEDSDDMLPAVRSVDLGQPAVVASVRKIVAQQRPELREYFNRQFTVRQAARPLQFAFVGKRLAANITQLNARSPGGLSTQIDRAKAKILDLESLRDGKAVDALPLKSRQKLTYELYVSRPSLPKSSASGRLLREAEASLESQADDFDIQWRPFESAQQMARTLLRSEVA